MTKKKFRKVVQNSVWKEVILLFSSVITTILTFIKRFEEGSSIYYISLVEWIVIFSVFIGLMSFVLLMDKISKREVYWEKIK